MAKTEEIERLRTEYYQAISDIQDKNLIVSVLPHPQFYMFFEIMEGLIDKLNNDFEFIKQIIDAEVEKDDLEEYKHELEIINYKRQLCLEIYEEAKKNLQEEKAFKSSPNKHLIFATSNADNVYAIKDLKEIPEEYYEYIQAALNNLETGVIEDNPERAKQLQGDVKDVHEVKNFKFRLYYQILSPDLAYIMLFKLKKSNNDLGDRLAVVQRKKNTANEFSQLKRLITDETFKEQLIKKNDLIKQDLIRYINANKRGTKNNGKQ